ncbi:MAG TPA: hypothetical protein VKU36_06015 [Candidatus Babeliales bacterium]|jgi:hypothetical protein|nr:hypothetical protein [Candidatus Babeliales bacterium]
MMNKNLLVALFLVSGGFAQAALQEKLTASKKDIAAAKQNIRAGKPVAAKDGCRTKGCSRCNKCNKC